MSRAVFLDTSAWFAALSPRDEWHAAGFRLYTTATRAGLTIVTTTLVLAEVQSLLLRWRGPDIGRRFLAAAFATPSHWIVAPDLDITRSATERWIDGFADQSFSLCDAVSFEIMRRERLTHALAFDRHFTAAGFNVIR